MKEKTRRCKYCNSEIKIEVGIHNWKNLLTKPTLEEGITFFIILILIVSVYTYKSDLNNIINYYENESYCNIQRNINLQRDINQSLLTNQFLNNQNNLIDSSNLFFNNG